MIFVNTDLQMLKIFEFVAENLHLTDIFFKTVFTNIDFEFIGKNELPLI